MNKLLCLLLGHAPKIHLDYIWGNMPREHKFCARCDKNLKFERPSKDRENQLIALGDIRDGDTRGCQPI